MGYVTAFRGRRDSYQVPLALAEQGRLDSFVTDFYCKGWESNLASLLPGRKGESLKARRIDGIAPGLVSQLRLTAVLETAARVLKVAPASIYETFDPRYGQAAAAQARRHKSDLLMYSSYAAEAFSGSYSHDPRKVLFQYHPHHQLETNIIEADNRLCAKLGIAFADRLENENDRADGVRQRGDSAWKMADKIICASSFTKESLQAAGADPRLISVVPYGVEFSPEAPGAGAGGNDERFHALFVGSGLQRKGLHHLLLAWQRASLGKGACLTVVARAVDPGLAPLFLATPGVTLRRGVTDAELSQLYREATVFVMPSLVEGFGQVYLEALAHGLPVVGSRNSCLPDIGDEQHGIFLTDPGNVDALVVLLEQLSSRLPGDRSIRASASDRARRFTWPSFRAGLNAAV